MTYPQAKAKFPKVLSFVFLLLTIEIILLANRQQAIGRGQSCPSKALISSLALALTLSVVGISLLMDFAICRSYLLNSLLR
uniref:Uncharacterized protein n=1 Tax=Arundo donax TaxID=35708 RepID=A0A0A9D7V9_ARUDO